MLGIIEIEFMDGGGPKIGALDKLDMLVILPPTTVGILDIVGTVAG